jgi:hypothetical protein
VTEWGPYAFTAELWLHPGEGGWHFLTVPPEIGADIAERTTAARRGFGSVRVTAAVGGVVWRTSLFPDATSRSYLLPVKKGVRSAARLRAGDPVAVELEVRPLSPQ